MKTENYEKHFVFLAKRYSLRDGEYDENRILRMIFCFPGKKIFPTREAAV